MDDIPSYTFISTSYLAIVFNSSDNDLSNGPGCCPENIRIYRIREERGLPIGHVATLQLPQEVRGSTLTTPSVPCSPTPPPSAAFWPDPERRVVVLRLKVPEPSPPTNTFMRVLQPNHRYTPSQPSTERDALLVVPCTTFRKHLMDVATMGRNPAADLPISWGDWGLRGSVLIREVFANPAPSSYGPGQWPLSKLVFPFGSRLTFFLSESSASDISPRLVTVDVNQLSKFHPPHRDCTRRAALANVQKIGKTDERSVSSSLNTTYPRSYYLGPAFDDVQHAIAITQNSSGYAILVSALFSDLLPKTSP